MSKVSFLPFCTSSVAMSIFCQCANCNCCTSNMMLHRQREREARLKCTNLCPMKKPEHLTASLRVFSLDGCQKGGPSLLRQMHSMPSAVACQAQSRHLPKLVTRHIIRRCRGRYQGTKALERKQMLMTHALSLSSLKPASRLPSDTAFSMLI